MSKVILLYCTVCARRAITHAPGHLQAAVEPLLHLKHLTFSFPYIRRYEAVVRMSENPLHLLLQTNHNYI